MKRSALNILAFALAHYLVHQHVVDAYAAQTADA